MLGLGRESSSLKAEAGAHSAVGALVGHLVPHCVLQLSASPAQTELKRRRVTCNPGEHAKARLVPCIDTVPGSVVSFCVFFFLLSQLAHTIFAS